MKPLYQAAGYHHWYCDTFVRLMPDITLVHQSGDAVLLADTSHRTRVWLDMHGMGWIEENSTVERRMAATLAAELSDAGLLVCHVRAH